MGAFRCLLLLGPCLLWPAIAHADVGLPMLVVAFPGMAAAFIPIVLLESWFIARGLAMGRRRALLVSLAANAASTFVGVPVTWMGLVLLELPFDGAYGLKTFGAQLFAVTAQAAWLIPYDSELHWMVPAAASALLVPFFFMSWQLEKHWVHLFARQHALQQVGRVMLRANLTSYALLLASTLSWLISELWT